MSGTLHKLGERKGYVQFSYSGTIKNIGNVRTYVIALAFTASGFTLTPQSTASSRAPYKGAIVYERDARVEPGGVIYNNYRLTHHAEADLGDRFVLDPAQEIPFSGVFAVKNGRFDSIALSGSIAYAKFARTYPTAVRSNVNGAVVFFSTNHDPDYQAMEVTMDRASLW